MNFFFQLGSIPYWYYVNTSSSQPNSDATTLVLYIISAILLIAVAACGCFGTFFLSVALLAMFAMVNLVMYVFEVVQVILTYVTYLDCQDQGNRFPNSPFTFICQQGTNDGWYWVPVLILIYINICAVISACCLRWRIIVYKRKKKGDYFG
jgi:hypothetical protein